MKAKILVIEDDREVIEAISLLIQTTWPDSQIVSRHLGGSGIQAVRDENPDIVLLDLALPDIDGFEILEKILHNR